MKVFEVRLSLTTLVAAESEAAAERWAERNAGDIAGDITLACDDCRQIETFEELNSVGDGTWTAEAQPYGLPSGDSRTLAQLLVTEKPYRCPQTVDMFRPSPNPVTAGIDRDTTGAIGQP